MELQREDRTRRDFLKLAGLAGAGAVGVLAFPSGLTEVIEAVGPDTARVTRTYPRLKLAGAADLKEGEPLDFAYPLETQSNFMVKLGTASFDSVGPEKDIVAFNYLCSHMGCPLNGTYKHEYKMLGPCPCHYSRFDLSKNGIMIIGQATQSLPQIVLEVENDDIYATGVTGLVYGYWNNLEGATPVSAG